MCSQQECLGSRHIHYSKEPWVSLRNVKILTLGQKGKSSDTGTPWRYYRFGCTSLQHSEFGHLLHKMTFRSTTDRIHEGGPIRSSPR